MDFRLSEEQQAIQEMTGKFARDVLLPGIRDREENYQMARDELSQLYEMGFASLLVPEEAGGMGLDAFSFALAIEQLAVVDPAIALIVSHQNVFGSLMLYNACKSGEESDNFAAVCAGERQIAWASAWDPANPLEINAEGGKIRASGTLRWITGGETASSLLVGLMNESGRCGFLLSLEQPGVSRNQSPRLLGLRTAGIQQVTLKDAEVSTSCALVLKERFPQEVRIASHLGWAAVSLGMMRGMVELSTDYAAEREQFGRTINKFEAIRFKLVEMRMAEESLRSILYRSASWMVNSRLDESERLARMAQLSGARGAAYCGRECVQIHGGYGYSREYHAERYMRDSRAMELIGGGTERISELIAKKLIED